MATVGDYVLFVGKDRVGEGDPVLGANLLKMALNAFAEADELPAAVLVMNSGVRALSDPENDDVPASLGRMAEEGTEVLSCGTCLDFYGVKDALRVGEVSNMATIMGRMRAASKVIAL
ncbi:sulfurtransferase-like selenium metabolism protein YedF [Gordonibacter sp. Marseille-P4307]|uniref:sulfurtransferase-like selenium metabolism protein YedF n=1 Tax=Gordonibacter sp. Marseille-P4307 TaxID=2161815 RepID=UPI0013DDD3BD|nr:sulfurtransferase-like selenium metabolism protein YedF [Gordonibacter sp. Marseille-P4307]